MNGLIEKTTTFIKNLLGGIFSFIGKLFQFGKDEKPQLASASSNGQQSQSSPNKAAAQVQETASQATTQVKEAVDKAAFFLSGDDARSFKSSSNGKQPSVNKAEKTEKPKSLDADTAKAFNLAKPKVTTYKDFSNYGDRRRPGANMSNFLEMARNVNTSKAKASS